MKTFGSCHLIINRNDDCGRIHDFIDVDYVGGEVLPLHF